MGSQVSLQSGNYTVYRIGLKPPIFWRKWGFFLVFKNGVIRSSYRYCDGFPQFVNDIERVRFCLENENYYDDFRVLGFFVERIVRLPGFPEPFFQGVTLSGLGD